MTSEQMKKHFNIAAKSLNAKKAFSEAKGTFHEMKKDGSLKEKGESTNIEQ